MPNFGGTPSAQREALGIVVPPLNSLMQLLQESNMVGFERQFLNI
jgi:hypothetical protein